MAESLEYKTLVRCRSKLVTALQLDPPDVADVLISKGLIPPSVASETSELARSAEKSRRLVECIFNKVELSADSYHSFIDAFTECGWLKDLIGILNAARRELSSAVDVPEGADKTEQPQSQAGELSSAVDVPEGADQTKQPQSKTGELSCVVDSAKQVKGIVQSQTETDAQIMKSNEDEIKALFSILLDKIQEDFELQNVSVTKVRRFLMNFFQKEDCFLSATTFDDIFRAMTVNHLWDYQNYSPLEKLTSRNQLNLQLQGQSYWILRYHQATVVYEIQEAST